MPSLDDRLQAIRRRSAGIVAAGDIVTINDAPLSQLAEKIALSPADDMVNPFVAILKAGVVSRRSVIALLLYFSVMNYCYIDPASKQPYRFRSRDGRVYARSTGFIKALSEAPLDWSDTTAVQQISIDEWGTILQLTSDNTLYDAAGRLQNMQTMASYLSDVDLDIFFKSYNSYTSLGAFLEHTKLYDDPFLKRLQVTLAWAGELAAVTGFDFDNDVRLTVMADYRLPQVLYNLDCLNVSASQIIRLQNQTVLLPDDPLETALRAATITGCEKLHILTGMPEADIDRLLWRLSQTMLTEGRMLIPAPLVATDRY